MSTDKHQAEVLADKLTTRNGNPTGFGLGPVCDKAAAMLRTIPALESDIAIMRTDHAEAVKATIEMMDTLHQVEAERDALRAELALVEKQRDAAVSAERELWTNICNSVIHGAEGFDDQWTSANLAWEQSAMRIRTLGNAAAPVSQQVAWLYALEYGSSTVNRKVSMERLRYPFGVCGPDYLRSNKDGVSYVRETPLYTAAPLAHPLTDEPDIIAIYSGSDGSREWWSGGTWLRPGEAVAIIKHGREGD